MASLTPEQREKGVICSSAGNHAQGVALAGRTLVCYLLLCCTNHLDPGPDIKERGETPVL